jgi:hypothetical protein
MMQLSDIGNLIQLLTKGNYMDDAESMQTQGDSPTPPTSVPEIQDSVEDSDLHTDNVGNNHEHTADASDAPSRTMMVHTGLVLAALLLATLGVMSDAWSVEERSTTILDMTISVESEIGLDDFSVTSCTDGNCTSAVDDLGGAYDNCTSLASDFDYNSSKTEEMCGDIGATASAGFTGMTLITIGIIALVTSLVATLMRSRGTTLPLAQYYSFVGAGSMFIGIVAWYFMMPEPPTGSDPSLGYGAWMAIASIVLAAAAGGYAIYNGGSVQSSSIISRMPGIGVRALTAESEAREFVLRENAMGTKSTSLVEQGKVLRLVYAKLDNEDVVTEDHFIVQKAALTGFTHYRYDWLDNGKYMWWLMTGVGIISLFISPAIGSPLLLIGVLFSLAQLFDPELLSFETNAGRHRLLLYRQDSNRELTNFSMDEIDSKMQQLLSGEQLDGESVEMKAAEIEENRAAEIEEKRAAEIKAEQEAAAALELAKIAAAAAPVIGPPATPIPIPGIEPTQQPVAGAVAGPIVVEPEVVIPPPPAPTGPFTEVQSLPPPLPLPPQTQPLPPLSLLDEPLPPPPLSLLDEPLPPPPPSWDD